MDLIELKGIGQKNKEYFSKLGVDNVKDLLEFFPRDYELFFAPTTISEIGYKTMATIKGVFNQTLFERKSGKLKITSSEFQDEVGQKIRVVWFNAPYVKQSYSPHVPYIIRGRISRKFGVKQIDQPRVFTIDEYKALMGQMMPVYPLTKGLSNALIIKAIKQALSSEVYNELDTCDFLPSCIKEKYGLIDKSVAIKNLHFPTNQILYQQALVRMSFEEIFLFLYCLKENEDKLEKKSDIIIRHDKRTEQFINKLPFELTNAQKKVILEINNDMSSSKVMNRLIQGDVGSGKTMVALSALMDCAFSGYQGALMAPTEVLANQHYETISKLFKENDIELNIALLTGSMTALEKKVVYNALEDGKIDILIGTHTLFQEKVNYKNLGLIITDEQHRFGIKQRQALQAKGIDPHMIVMSATPIPRTLALIVYGNMDVSVIDELPKARKPIKNAVVDDSYKDNAYRFIQKEVALGHQVYIICPLVEYSEGVEAQNVTDYTQMLKEIMPENIKIGMLHGQMKAEKKNEVMQNFSDGNIDILVSTTVVEVGVDVPNATVMMIEDANRFGLATLHQLRGRIGRGAAQSYCIFVSNNNSKESMERLEVLNHSNNGFEIASKDLEMRGPGEFMGIRQSGALSFKNFDIYRDATIAMNAKEAINDIFIGKIKLSEHEIKLLNEKNALVKGGIVL